MASTTLLIDNTAFEPYTDIAQHLRTEYIDREILATQDTHVAAVLGSILYETLQSETELATLTPPNATLIGKLTPWLCYQSSVNYAMTDFAQANESGYRVQSNSNDRPLTDDERAAIVNKYKALAAVHKRNFLAWLQENKDDYPTLEQSSVSTLGIGIYKVSGKSRRDKTGRDKSGRQWI